MDKGVENTNLIISGYDVFTLDEKSTRIGINQEIHISGNKIQAVKQVGKGEQKQESLPNQIMDGRGMLAIPGLINTHVYVPMVFFRGLIEDVTIESWFNDYIFPLESNLTPEDVYWDTLLGIAEMLKSDVTYVADHYFFMDTVARAVEESGMRANLVMAVFGHEGEVKQDETSDFVTR